MIRMAKSRSLCGFKISGPETYFIAGNQLSPMVSSMGEGMYEYVLRL
jgi:hypothetical protein